MKNKNTANTELFKLKLAVVNHHKGSHNEYLRSAIAKDACYSANNSIQYKIQQMLDLKEEIKTLRPTAGTEVVDVKLAKKVDIYQRMADELAELTERFETDKAVYKTITDEDWKPYTKSSVKEVSAVLDQLDKLFGKDEKPIQESI